MTPKVFWFRPDNGGTWHSPNEILARLVKVFDHVSADREQARIRGNKFISRYRSLIEAGLGDRNSTPLEVVERQWANALILRVSDDSEDMAPFEVVVCNEYRLELQFTPKAPYQNKRRSAEKAARALGYVIEHFDADD